MEHEWLVREIEDLRDFARLNELPRAAEALDQARLVAQVELANRLASTAPLAGAR